MAVAYDTSNRLAFASGTTESLSHTCTGSNLILFANFGIVNSTDLLSSVTYNGVAMTVLQSHFTAAVGFFAYQAYLVAPATGANNITVNISGGVAKQICIDSISYTGVKQSAPVTFAQQTGASLTTWSQSLVTVDDNSWVMAFLGDSAGRAITAGANTVVRQDGAGQGDHLVDSNSPKTPAGTDTLNISNFAGVSTQTDSLMVAISPFTAAPVNGNFLAFM